MKLLSQIGICLLITFLFTSCDIGREVEPSVDKVVDSFDNAIAEITQQSIAWQETLMTLEDEIAEDISDIIENELTDLIQESIANAGIEVRCNVDAFRLGMRAELIKLKNKYLEAIGKDPIAAVYIPNVCHVSSNPIESNVTEVEFYGSGFVHGYIDAYIVKSNGEKELINRHLTLQSRYQMTILLSGIYGLETDSDNAKISVECPICPDDRKIISEVPFIAQGSGNEGGGSEGDIGFTEMFGINEGVEFIDFYSSLDVKRISGIRINANGGAIFGIAMQWENHSGQKEWTTWRGLYPNVDTYEILFDDDEEWIGMIGHSRLQFSGNTFKGVDQLTFITNKRAIGPYGNKTDASNFTLMDIGKIIGLSTRIQYNRLSAIGLVVRN